MESFMAGIVGAPLLAFLGLSTAAWGWTAGVVGVSLFAVVRLVAHAAVHRQQPRRRRRKALVGRRARCPRGGSSRSTARRAFRPRCCAAASTSALALAVPDPQDAAGDDAARQDRLRLRPGRRAAAVRARRWAEIVACNNFQDARAFLVGEPASPETEPSSASVAGSGRSCAKAFTPSTSPLFVVITEDTVYRARDLPASRNCKTLVKLAERAARDRRLQPGRHRRPDRSARPAQSREDAMIVDSMGIVTVHDGPSLPPGEIIAPAVGTDRTTRTSTTTIKTPRRSSARRPPRSAVCAADRRHLLHQPLVRHGRVDPQDGRADRLCRRGRQLLRPDRARPLGRRFRHGERVAEGERGVWEKPLGPGKYPFNTYAGNIILVPTTNFVLHWVTGRTESHRYDESLRSIDLVTKDAYEPLLPLSVVVHIDYQKAPSVIQRFGDVKKLITQTLDPMLSAYFRDVAHKKTMLELLHERDAIQHEAREELRRQVPRLRHRMRRRPDRQARHGRRPAARSRPCSNSCGCGSCRSSRSRPIERQVAAAEKLRSA